MGSLGHYALRTMCLGFLSILLDGHYVSPKPSLAYDLGEPAEEALCQYSSTQLSSHHHVLFRVRFRAQTGLSSFIPSLLRRSHCNHSASRIECRDSLEQPGLLECPSHYSTTAAASPTVDSNGNHAPHSAAGSSLA